MPPDCFRQPRRTVSWPLVELVADELLLSVLLWLLLVLL